MIRTEIGSEYIGKVGKLGKILNGLRVFSTHFVKLHSCFL